jgi:molecular chaperone GrpE
MSETPETEPDKPIDDEIERVLAEAEAAVGAVRAGKDDDDADPTAAAAEIDETDPDGDGATEIDIESVDEPAEDPAGSGGDSRDSADAGNADAAAELAAARAQVESIRDKWLRAVADHENYKKRVKRDVDDAVHRAVSKLLDDFLGVPDNLERALEASNEDDSQLVTGIRMVMTSFMAALGKHGITAVPAVGTPFDPAIHDALQQFDSPDYAPGIVIQEFEKGYIKDDRLLRPARVIVAGAGSTGTAGGAGDGQPSGDDDADAEDPAGD